MFPAMAFTEKGMEDAIRLLEAGGLSQSEIASRCGVSPSTVSRLARGELSSGPSPSASIDADMGRLPAALSFRVAGEVKGEPRPRATRQGGFTRVYSDRKVDPWRERVREAVLATGRLQDGGPPLFPHPMPLHVSIAVSMARPQSHFRQSGGETSDVLKGSAPAWPTKKPDLDNVAKLLMDGMQQSRLGVPVYQDDSQVVSLTIRKHWASPDMPAGAFVVVTPARAV